VKEETRRTKMPRGRGSAAIVGAAVLLAVGRELEAGCCGSPVGATAEEWQIAGRKILSWGEKNTCVRDARVLAGELLHVTEPYHRLMAREWLKLLVGARGASLGS
jgi:hypothetical protein